MGRRVAEDGAEPTVGVRQRGRHGAAGDAEGLGDLGLGKIGDIPKENHGARPLGQILHRVERLAPGAGKRGLRPVPV